MLFYLSNILNAEHLLVIGYVYSVILLLLTKYRMRILPPPLATKTPVVSKVGPRDLHRVPNKKRFQFCCMFIKRQN